MFCHWVIVCNIGIMRMSSGPCSGHTTVNLISSILLFFNNLLTGCSCTENYSDSTYRVTIVLQWVLSGRVAILVITYNGNFKADVIVFTVKVIMYLTSHWLIKLSQLVNIDNVTLWQSLKWKFELTGLTGLGPEERCSLWGLQWDQRNNVQITDN